jgi:hypothetical protein
MLHSADENGDPLPVGEIRTCAAYTSGHIYPAASKEGLETAINKYYSCLDKKYHFLVYALQRAGFPFAVPLTSGHSKARKHYILAICNAQKRDTGMPPNKQLIDLISLVLKSCYYKIVNYEAKTV